LYNIGISAMKVPAIVAIMLYRYYLLDGGYYPVGGMQTFSGEFAKRFVELNGKLILNRKIEKIVIKNKTICGVKLSNGDMVNCKYVVSNADATQTFEELLEGSVQKRILLSKSSESPHLYLFYI